MGSGKSILVVEDDLFFQKYVIQLLSDYGWAVVRASNAEEASGHLGKSSFDVVLADFNLPGANGVTVLSQAQTLQPETRRILMSAQNDARARLQAEGIVSLFLPKPFPPSALLHALDAAPAPEGPTLMEMSAENTPQRE